MKRQINQVLVISLLVLMALPLQGNSPLDRLGPVYPIIEPDWLEWLPKQAEKRLRERPLALSKEQIKEAIQRQMPHMDLPEVKVPRTYYVDPAVKVNQPVADHTGRIVIPAGGRINPLEYLPGFRLIVVVDGRKEQQVEWVKGVITQIRPLVLITAGDVLELNTMLGMAVYPAPQAIIDRFSIQRVPVILSRQGKTLKVEEVVP
jgi:conjugal transfer pilus assembly protein TraW